MLRKRIRIKSLGLSLIGQNTLMSPSPDSTTKFSFKFQSNVAVREIS